MKVLVVNWRDIYHPKAGGAEVHIHQLLSYKPPDWEVDFVSTAFPGAALLEHTEYYRIERIESQWPFHWAFRFYWRKALKARNYDLIIDDISKIPLQIHRFVKRIPIIGVLHHIHGYSLRQELGFGLGTAVAWMEYCALRSYRNVPMICVSKSTLRELQEIIDIEEHYIVHNGILISHFPTCMGAKATQPTICSVGRLVKYKRIDLLIQAFALLLKRFPQATLRIVGQGYVRSELKTLVQQLHIEDAVVFTGYLENEEKQKELSQAWVHVQPSSKEGWGISTIEAAACWTPSVAYAVPGLRDAVLHEETGLLVNPDGSTPVLVEALAQAMARILRDTELRSRLSHRARAFAEKLDMEFVSNDFYAIIIEIMSRYRDV